MVTKARPFRPYCPKTRHSEWSDRRSSSWIFASRSSDYVCICEQPEHERVLPVYPLRRRSHRFQRQFLVVRRRRRRQWCRSGVHARWTTRWSGADQWSSFAVWWLRWRRLCNDKRFCCCVSTRCLRLCCQCVGWMSICLEHCLAMSMIQTRLWKLNPSTTTITKTASRRRRVWRTRCTHKLYWKQIVSSWNCPTYGKRSSLSAYSM